MANLVNHSIKKTLLGISIAVLMLPSLALAARTSIDWVNLSGTSYIQPNFGSSGMDLLIYGSDHYINFNTVTGASGYGFRDNGGTMEFKNSGGAWTSLGVGGTGITGLGSGFATTTAGAITLAISTLSFNGLTIGQTIAPSVSSILFTPTVSGTLNNAGLTNSTISGVALGSNLNSLTINNSGSGAASGATYNGSAGTTISYNTIGAQVAGTYLTALGNYSTTTATGISISTSTAAFNGLTLGNIFSVTSNGILVTPTMTGTLNNAGLANSTISGISLGGTLGALSATDATLTFSGSYTGATARTVGINLGNANTWTALQAQASTGTTTFSGGIEVGGKIGTPYIMATSTATSTFAGGLNITGNDCYAQLGTCLQTYIQNATAYKQAVNYASAAVLAGTPTYANGVSGVGATLTEVGFGALVVDGQNPTIGQRVLIKDQAAQLQNGIYTVTTVGSGIASYLLTRSTDYNTSVDIYAGTTVPVLAGGSTNGDTQWTETTTGTITVGTTAIAFEETAFGTTGPTSVSNSDGTLTISPTTGAVVGSIALGHSNIWSALQLSSNTGTTTYSGGIESPNIGAATIFATSTTKASSIVSASTTNLTVGTSNYAVNGLSELPLSVASSTWGTGTTTVTMLGTTRALTVVDASCPNDIGLFLGVDIYYGSTHLNYLISSSTQNTFLFTTNNVVPAGSKLLIDIGTSTAPAAGYKRFNCSLEYAYNSSS